MNFISILDGIEKLLTSVAILGGGIWAYFNFVKGRVYHLRLEPKISGSIICKGRIKHLQANPELKNVGLSQVELQQKGTGLRVYSYSPETQGKDNKASEWEHIRTLPVFVKHAWIESQEHIEDQQLIQLPANVQIACKLELRVVSNKHSWVASNIIAISDEKDDIKIERESEIPA